MDRFRSRAATRAWWRGPARRGRADVLSILTGFAHRSRATPRASASRSRADHCGLRSNAWASRRPSRPRRPGRGGRDEAGEKRSLILHRLQLPQAGVFFNHAVGPRGRLHVPRRISSSGHRPTRRWQTAAGAEAPLDRGSGRRSGKRPSSARPNQGRCGFREASGSGDQVGCTTLGSPVGRVTMLFGRGSWRWWCSSFYTAGRSGSRGLNRRHRARRWASPGSRICPCSGGRAGVTDPSAIRWLQPSTCQAGGSLGPWTFIRCRPRFIRGVGSTALRRVRRGLDPAWGGRSWIRVRHDGAVFMLGGMTANDPFAFSRTTKPWGGRGLVGEDGKLPRSIGPRPDGVVRLRERG